MHSDELNFHLLKTDKKEALNEIRASFLIWGCSRLAEVLLYENEDKSL
ncbi:hypothetical protein ACN6Q9_18785 [Acinetobacter baumannii]